MRILPYLALFLLISACSSSPTGRQQLILFPDSQMNEMGAASFTQIKQQTPPSTETAALRYVHCISDALLLAAGENPSHWEVQVFDDESPNAFALPGRKIGVHTGMFTVATNADQLAAVIGHEIGHVQARHGAERVSMNVLAETGQQLTAGVLQNNEAGQLTMAALGLATQFGVLLPYSRKHESEADYIGLELMAKAGFDPQQSVALWQNMARAAQGSAPPEFMSTHPSSDTRIRLLSEAMPKAQSLYQPNRKPDCIKPY